MSSNQILGTIRKLEFIGEWIITSQFPHDKTLFEELFVVVETFKFYYRMKILANSNIYIEQPNKQQQNIKQPKFLFPNQVEPTKLQLNKLLEAIKTKEYEKYEHNVGASEITRTGKKISLKSNFPVPKILWRSRIHSKQIMGQILYILRPLIYIITIRIYGLKSYKPFIISLIIDLLRIITQKKIKVTTETERQQLKNRNSDMIFKTLFRAPFYEEYFKKFVVYILSHMINQKGWIMKIIMYIFQVKSTLTLTI